MVSTCGRGLFQAESRKLISFLILLLLFLPTGFNNASQAGGLQAFKYVDVARAISVNSIQEHVKYLSGLRCRTPGYPGYGAAAKYIYENFVKNGLKPGPQGFFENFTILVPIVHDAVIQIVSPIESVIDDVSVMYPMGLNPGRTPPSVVLREDCSTWEKHLCQSLMGRILTAR